MTIRVSLYLMSKQKIEIPASALNLIASPED